jgi:hypothetical protein
MADKNRTDSKFKKGDYLLKASTIPAIKYGIREAFQAQSEILWFI